MVSAFPSVRIGCSSPDFRKGQPHLYPVSGIFIGPDTGHTQQL